MISRTDCRMLADLLERLSATVRQYATKTKEINQARQAGRMAKKLKKKLEKEGENGKISQQENKAG